MRKQIQGKDIMEYYRIAKLEPKLNGLYYEIQAYIKDHKGVCPDKLWYGDIKPQMIRIVGYLAKNESVKTSEAYDIAYSVLYDLMPYCSRNCPARGLCE